MKQQQQPVGRSVNLLDDDDDDDDDEQGKTENGHVLKRLHPTLTHSLIYRHYTLHHHYTLIKCIKRLRR